MFTPKGAKLARRIVSIVSEVNTNSASLHYIALRIDVGPNYNLLTSPMSQLQTGQSKKHTPFFPV